MKEKIQKAGKSVLRIAFRTALLFMIYTLIDGICFGFEAGWRIPEHEDIVQIEMWNSDHEKGSIEREICTEPHSLEMACALVSLTCDYKLIPPMNPEDIPRFTMVMTLEDGREYTLRVGDTTVAFNGTYKVLRDIDAAKILTQQLLG